MALNELVQNLKDIVEGFAPSFNAKIEELNTVKAQCLASVASVANALASLSPIAYHGNVFIDNINGDDTNDGLSIASPVKTWAVLCAIIPQRRCVIWAVGDLLLDTSASFSDQPPQIEIRCVDSAGAPTSGVLTIVDATNRPGFAGGFVVGGLLSLGLRDFDVDLAYTVTRGGLFNSGGRYDVTIINGDISRSGTGGHLFSGTFSGHFTVVNSTIDPSAAGYVIDGVVANGDPNSVNGLTANFTQG